MNATSLFPHYSPSQANAGNGSVIVTADADQGTMNTHGSRSLVISSEDAREWIDPDTSPEEPL